VALKLDWLGLHAFWNSFASNVASPFVTFNVTASGASDLLISYVSTIGTLASGVTQLIGGWVADRTGKRVAIAGAFSIVAGILWLGTAEFQTPAYLALFFTAITLVQGVYAAGWTAILGEGSEGRGRGVYLGGYARITSAGALAGLVLTTVISSVNPSFTILYIVSGVLFIVSAGMLRGQREQRVEKAPMTSSGSSSLRRYYTVSGIYGLFWGFAWPLFTITLVKVVHMNLFQYSFAQVIGLVATVALQPLVGRLVDRDRRRWVFWGRMSLVIYPITYMFFSAAWQVYAVNIVAGFTNSLLNIAFVAYLYDLAPAGQRGRVSAEFNLVTGASTMAGSLISGYTLSIISTPDTLWVSLAYLYVIAAVGRAVAALLHLRLPYAKGPGIALLSSSDS
jgi:MFS family permease